MTQLPTDVAPIADWNRLLEGKIVVVTGGGDGIGGAISRLFAQHGGVIELAEINPESADRAVADITREGGSAHANITDVTKEEDVHRLAHDVLERRGRVDVLVNNVGDYRPLVRFGKS